MPCAGWMNSKVVVKTPSSFEGESTPGMGAKPGDQRRGGGGGGSGAGGVSLRLEW